MKAQTALEGNSITIASGCLLLSTLEHSTKRFFSFRSFITMKLHSFMKLIYVSENHYDWLRKEEEAPHYYLYSACGVGCFIFY
jgi:hypothetical protein